MWTIVASCLGRRKRTVRALPRTVRPHLEAMEDRLVPAVSLGIALQPGISYTASAAQVSVVQPKVQVDPVPSVVGGIGSNDVVDIDYAPSVGEKDLQPIQGFPPLQRTFDLDRDRVQVGLQQIRLKVQEYQGLLGQPMPGSAKPQDDGYGFAQHFKGGSVYWSPGTGAHVVYGAIREKFQALGGVAAFGYPATDELALEGYFYGARYNDFRAAGGTYRTIVWTSETGAHALVGAIRTKWIDQGAGRYAIPINDEYAVGSRSHHGLMQDFRYQSDGEGDSLSIVWSSRTGAHDLAFHGVLTIESSGIESEMSVGARTRWLSLGGAEGIGFPINDQMDMTPGGKGRNTVVHFVKYSFFTDEDGNPIVDRSAIADVSIRMVDGHLKSAQVHVYGKIYRAWMANGGESFGMPISGEEDAGTYRYVRFETIDGIKEIRWEKKSDKMFVVLFLPSGDSVSRSVYPLTIETPWDGSEASTSVRFSDAWSRHIADQASLSHSYFDVDNAALLRQITLDEHRFGTVVSEEPIDIDPPAAQENPSADAEAERLSLAVQLALDLHIMAADEVYTNGYGAGEKWLVATDGTWYFMLPDGSLYLWDWSNAASGTLILTLDPTFYDNPALIVEGVPSADALDVVLAAMA
jgi:uncharacterized protein with LGFP repeats